MKKNNKNSAEKILKKYYLEKYTNYISGIQ